MKVNLNQYSVLTRKTLIYGGVHGFEGVALAILPNGPCLNCVFGSFENDELCELGGTCRSGGVVGGIAGIVGLLQVENLLAIYSESSEAFTPHLRTVNQFGQIRQMKINADINCLNGCGIRPRKLVDLTNFKCPDTFVYAKLTLEKLKSHDYVELEFASESILHNVSDSIQKEGYKNLKKLFNPEFNKFNLIVETKNK